MSRRPHKLLTRRRFLSRSASAAALGLSGLAGSGRGCASAPPGSWGIPASDRERSAMLPDDLVPDGVLELFLYGGINPWDSFYVVPEYGDPSRGGAHADAPWMWWTFQDGPGSIPSAYERCGGRGELLLPFGRDSLGNTVHLGPFLEPLRQRPDLLARTRLLVMSHDQAAHQGACPLMLCGQRRGSPRMAGTAAHVQRFADEHAAPDQTLPASWVLFPDLDLANDNVDSAAALGLHRASSRPLTLKLSARSRFSEQLSRPHLDGRQSSFDALGRHYLERYGERARRRGNGQAEVRMPALADLRNAQAALADSGSLAGLLPPGLLALPPGSRCEEDSEHDGSGSAIRLATQLLTRPEDAARYVTVVDGGLVPATGGGGYDTHVAHVRDSARNLTHSLAELVGRINQPGERDPAKLDLDRHLVAITTEFGRTPYPQSPGSDGLDHWPFGYAVALIGGPIDEERAGVIGGIDEEGVAVEYVSPAELRAALLLAQGIWPFQADSYAVSDVREGITEAAAAHWLRDVVLGRPA